MTFYEEIAAVQARLAKAHAERDTWRASGLQEKYLEAYSRVQALELQLERLREEGLRATRRNQGRLLTPAPAEPAPASVEAPAPAAPADRERLMAEHSISFDGRRYHYARYRYDNLADALAYAKLQHSLGLDHSLIDPTPPAQQVEAPDASQRQLMATLAITFADGVYHLGPYRYDRLADAVSYARHQRAEQGPGHETHRTRSP